MAERKKMAQQGMPDFKFNPAPIDNLRVKPITKPLGKDTLPFQPNQNPYNWDRNGLGKSNLIQAQHSYGSASTPVYSDPHKIDQILEDGWGDVQYQEYEIVLSANEMDFKKLMDTFLQEPGRITDNILADYTSKSHKKIAAGDVITIDILGPLNGKVRVVSVNYSVNRFATTFQPLIGHPEAGIVTFECEYIIDKNGRKTIVFKISNVTRQQLGIFRNWQLAEMASRYAQGLQWEAVLKNISNFLKKPIISAQKNIIIRQWDERKNMPGKIISKFPKPKQLNL